GHSAEQPHHIFSGTKSFASIVAMLAEADGILELDEHVADTITEWKGDAKRERITVRQLLDFTSGLRKIDARLHSRRTEDKYALAVSTRAVREPGRRFQYGSVHLTVFGEFLKRKLRAFDAEKYAQADYVTYLTERLLDPIGCHVANWIRDQAGNPMVPYGAFLTAREWAKFGLFLLHRGEVRGEALLEPDKLSRCFVGSKANPNYGLNFWLVSEDGRTTEHVPADTIGAFGMYKQKLWVIPSRDLVIVRFGKTGVLSGFRDSEFFARLFATPAATTSRPTTASLPSEPGTAAEPGASADPAPK
ncbi:MAG: serine hydrolase, partial [Planctomycetes bacterium]|nr:serine hydrolase [Planctomycetota bacterium]